MLREAKIVASGEWRVASENKIQKFIPPTTHTRLLATNSYLMVAIAPDAIVGQLKGHAPRHTSSQRIAMLKSEHLADEVILADSEAGSWTIIKKTKPNIIALGYDQHELRTSLETFLDQNYPDVETAEGEWQTNPKRPKIVILSAHQPDRFHNHLLHS